MRFRRRPLRRLRFRPRIHVFRRKLREAHRWMETGRPAEAGKIFAEIAQAAADHDRPIASQLFLQAGRAYLDAGKMEMASSLLMQSLRIMIEQGDPRLGPISQRLTAELRAKGYPDLAQAMEQILPADLVMSARGSLAPTAPDLPAKCPYCGGNVHAEQVDRSDPERPACAYCGSPLLGDE